MDIIKLCLEQTKDPSSHNNCIGFGNHVFFGISLTFFCAEGTLAKILTYITSPPTLGLVGENGGKKIRKKSLETQAKKIGTEEGDDWRGRQVAYVKALGRTKNYRSVVTLTMTRS